MYYSINVFIGCYEGGFSFVFFPKLSTFYYFPYNQNNGRYVS